MKIVMLCDFYNETLEYQENLLVKYYTKHGHAVTVLTSTFESVFDYYEDRHDSRAPDRVYRDGRAKVVKLRYRYNLRNRLRALAGVPRTLEEEQPDLIFVHDIMPNILDAVAYQERHPKCRVIMDYHADYSNSGKNWLSLKILHGVIRKWFLDRARERLSRIFPIVPASATFLREIYGVPDSEMELLPLGADTDLGKEIQARGEGRVLRSELRIPDDHTVIFTGGKLEPGKRTDVLIEAFRKLADRRLELVVIGDSSRDSRSYKERLVELAGNEANIHFTGWLDRRNVYRHLAMADLAVFPSGQSIIWQQAISMGLPLIVGDIGHQDASYLNAYRNIVLLRRDELSSGRLAEVISQIVSDRKALQQMREGALKVANELLDWNRLIEKTLRFN